MPENTSLTDAAADLLVNDADAEALKQASPDFLSLTLTRRQLCDLELLLNGAFSPLRGFMGKADYDAVVDKMRLADGRLWPVPVTLDVSAGFAGRLQPGDRIALRDHEGFMLAVLKVEEIWQPDRQREAELVYGTTSSTHPGVDYLLNHSGDHCLSGQLSGIQLPEHYEFEDLWHTPAELRAQFHKAGWRRVVAFQTSKPMHRLQREVCLEAAKAIQGHILLHPTVGMTKPGDLHYYARVHCYQAVQRHFPKQLSMLSLLPLAMRMAGPREALWHALVSQNYGCTHMIIGPRHAYPPAPQGGPGDAYPIYAGQELVTRYAEELTIEILPIEEMFWVSDRKAFLPKTKIQSQGLVHETYTDARMKQDLAHNRPIPGWFSYPEVERELRRAYPPRSRQGFTLFFTGFSGSGKSTLAKIIYAKLVELGGRPITLLDGDVVRMHLSSELGFSKEHRNLNIKRIGYVASEISKNGGAAICAPIAPYAETRAIVRRMIEEQEGAFIEIHVATPLEVCEARDRKGLYAKARRGEIKEFTGISDPYEVPEKPELRIDTTELSATEAAQEVFLYLLREGFLDEA